MSRRGSGEAGQAAPLYIMMVVGLLFLALALFAVGQAGATRNGAQSAADAAALAAAQKSRDEFETDLLPHLLDPDYLDDIFNGNPLGTFNGCAEAAYFAGQNGADIDGGGCGWASGGRWGFTVHVVTQESMGESILPGTENQHAKAHATAVVEPRCAFVPAQDGTTPPDDAPPPDEPGEEGDPEPVSPGALQCDDDKWTIDPEDLNLLPDMADLFSVRLAQD
ncbi:pilus assembly protein TadG-related protein [Streptomyces sp. NBC_01317]|uniref:pilus assembly protein TadG-related protein n=1 Tax=Streptomyces sp. NBC_01317 TaxID=2903822 RepID=UPI002E0EB02A|nr:pilus assembly protein TadG-related protein [Streptomyces sp. NBC_01317]